MPLPQLYQKPDLFPSDPRNRYHRFLSTRNGLKVEWKAYVAASYLAQWLFHGHTLRQLMLKIEDEWTMERFVNLPLAEPDWTLSPTLQGYTNISVDALELTATWPSERELAI